MSDIRKNWGYLTFGIVLCLLAVAIGSWLGSFGKAKAPSGYEPTAIPGIFVKDRIADLGMISPNRLIEATFDLFNSGRKSYVVKRVSADCGCATVNLTNHTLWPNESLVVPLTIDTSNLKSNAFRKGVLVELTRQGQKQVWKDVFRLTGKIDLSGTFVVWPGILDYGDMVTGAKAHKTIYIKADQALLKELPSMIEIQHPSEILSLPQVEYTGSLAIKPVEVRLAIAKEARSEKFESSIKVEVAGSPPLRIVIPVRARVADSLIINPESIYMAVSGKASLPSVDLTVGSADGKRLSIKKISSSLPLMWFVDKESASKNTTIITVIPSDEANLDGSLCGDIQIEMSDNTRHIVPVVLVPVKSDPKTETNSISGKNS